MDERLKLLQDTPDRSLLKSGKDFVGRVYRYDEGRWSWSFDKGPLGKRFYKTRKNAADAARRAWRAWREELRKWHARSG